VTRNISLETIRAASETVYQAAVRTPLIRLDVPEPRAGDHPTIFLKLESLQPIGSFKIRGAYNAVRKLGRDQWSKGVWTVSAGNAAQGVAFAARHVGAACKVMVIDTAPETKIRAIERFGATIVKASYDECWRTVERHGSDRMVGHFVHPFDNDDFISGNGTIGVEIHEDLPQVDAVIVPLGGGGLLTGIACALHELSPRTRIYAAEPETAAPLATSLRNGRPSYFDQWTASFVDGAGGRSVLQSMWPLLRDRVSESIVVSLDAVARAMKIAAERSHVIAEGAAACAIAAAISPQLAGRGHRNVVAVVSGGNIDLTRFAQLVGACT
jgi:threonine dehydratase